MHFYLFLQCILCPSIYFHFKFYACVVISSCCVLNEDLEAGVLGDGIYFVLQHSNTGVCLAQENSSHNIYDMLFIEEIIYLILKVFHYKMANLASLFIGMTLTSF